MASTNISPRGVPTHLKQLTQVSRPVRCLPFKWSYSNPGPILRAVSRFSWRGTSRAGIAGSRRVAVGSKCFHESTSIGLRTGTGLSVKKLRGDVRTPTVGVYVWAEAAWNQQSHGGWMPKRFAGSAARSGDFSTVAATVSSSVERRTSRSQSLLDRSRPTIVRQRSQLSRWAAIVRASCSSHAPAV